MRLNLNGQAMRSKGERTRGRIVQAARSLLEVRPLRELSVADIAKRAGISTSTFYLYFQDVPEALLGAIEAVDQATAELIDLLARDDKAEDVVDRAYRYIADWQINRALFRARNLVGDEVDERFVRARRASVAPLLEILAARLVAAQRQGLLPAELHPPSAAGAFLALIERLAVTPNIATGVVSLGTVTRACAYFLAILLRGVPHSDSASAAPSADALTAI